MKISSVYFSVLFEFLSSSNILLDLRFKILPIYVFQNEVTSKYQHFGKLDVLRCEQYVCKRN